MARRVEFTLHAPSTAPDAIRRESPLREKLYRAHVTRASEFGNLELDNTSIIVRELRLRKEKAQLLGYKSFAEFSLVLKSRVTEARSTSSTILPRGAASRTQGLC